MIIVWAKIDIIIKKIIQNYIIVRIFLTFRVGQIKLLAFGISASTKAKYSEGIAKFYLPFSRNLLFNIVNRMTLGNIGIKI